MENDAAGSGADSRLPAPARGRDGGDEFLLSEPGRSPVLDAAQVEVLGKYGTEYDVAAGDVLFADGDETYAVAIVGGGNSVGQATLFLSRSRSQVHVIIRANTLETSMSRYLVDRIEREPRITIWPHTQVTGLIGTDHLEGVRIRRAGQAAESDLAVRGLFVFIGAKPRTEWLAGQLAQDSHGFLLTGSDIPAARLDHESSAPLFLETSRPGIFAVGDVRSGSVKRAAAAMGEGSMAVRLVYDRLQSTGTV